MSDAHNPGATRDSQTGQTDENFQEDIAEQTPQRVHEQHLDADGGDTDKRVGQLLPNLTDDQLARLSILDPGTPLEQGAVYLDLNNRDRGPFKAIGGQEVGAGDRMIAKKMTDYELWNEIAGDDDDATIERPETT